MQRLVALIFLETKIAASCLLANQQLCLLRWHVLLHFWLDNISQSERTLKMCLCLFVSIRVELISRIISGVANNKHIFFRILLDRHFGGWTQ